MPSSESGNLTGGNVGPFKRRAKFAAGEFNPLVPTPEGAKIKNPPFSFKLAQFAKEILDSDTLYCEL